MRVLSLARLDDPTAHAATGASITEMAARYDSEQLGNERSISVGLRFGSGSKS